MPSENLPYLFAAYAVAWAGFFIYAFFASKRQHELEREIRELKQALAIRDDGDEVRTPGSDD